MVIRPLCFHQTAETSAERTPASEKRSAFSRWVIANVAGIPANIRRPGSPSEGVIVIAPGKSRPSGPKYDRIQSSGIYPPLFKPDILRKMTFG